MKLLSQIEIEDIYQRYVLVNNNADYFSRYATLPVSKNDKVWEWKGKDVARVIALLEFERMVHHYGLKSELALVFNDHNDPELQYIKVANKHVCNYDDDPVTNDLHTLNIPKLPYDFCMVNQTLEHLQNPHICIENIYKHLNEGAYFYCNVPTLNILHALPNNFISGFTPVGLGVLFASCGFKIIEIGQWGSFEYIQNTFKSHSWPDYSQVKSGLNEFNNPVITWILAKKEL